jgi:peptide deformylase
MSKSKKDEAVSHTPEEYRIAKDALEKMRIRYEEYKKAYAEHVLDHMNYVLYGQNWKEVLKSKKALEEFDKDLKELLDE